MAYSSLEAIFSNSFASTLSPIPTVIIGILLERNAFTEDVTLSEDGVSVITTTTCNYINLLTAAQRFELKTKLVRSSCFYMEAEKAETMPQKHYLKIFLFL